MSLKSFVTRDVRAALPAWVVARVLVLAAWIGHHLWVDNVRDGVRPLVSHQGLFAWDGVFYRGIADHGYRGEDLEALRFFPLFSLVGRLVHVVLALSPGAALLVVANLAALGAGALIHRVTLVETGDARAARRAAWYVAIVPPAFVLTFAYAEALFLVLAVGMFLALRRERWGWAAALGFAAALTRPTGLLLALPAAIEAGREVRQRKVGELGGRALAVLGPVLGAASYLWWVDREFGDWHIPLDVQDRLRGGTANPIVRLGEAAADLVHLEVDGLHFVFAIGFIALAVIAWRRLPLSYAVFSVAVIVTSLAANNLNSIERYALNAFPLVMALALSTPTRRSERLTAAVCSAGFVWMGALAWLGTYVP